MDMTTASATTVARALHERLVSLDMKQAEEAIEDARKVIWVSAFSGASTSAAAQIYARSPVATAMAADLAGRTLLQIEEVLQELRFGLYMNAFGAIPGTRFGALVTEAIERGDVDVRGKAPN